MVARKWGQHLNISVAAQRECELRLAEKVKKVDSDTDRQRDQEEHDYRAEQDGDDATAPACASTKVLHQICPAAPYPASLGWLC